MVGWVNSYDTFDTTLEWEKVYAHIEVVPDAFCGQ